MSGRKQQKANPAQETFQGGCGLVTLHPVLGPLMKQATPHFDNSYPMAKEDWAWITANGDLYANSHRRATPQEWAYVIAHCLLHLALGHIREDRAGDLVWNAACDCVAARYLSDLHIGTPPGELSAPLPPNTREEETLYRWLKEHSDDAYFRFSTMSGGRPDLVWEPIRASWWQGPTDWRQLFAESLRDALRSAVDYAGGVTTPPGPASGWWTTP